MGYGVCKLTGNSGTFVKAHLLPKAVTRPTVAGEYFISGGEGSRPKKSWSSWYDEELVIRKGEDILARYDNWAIAELRRLELIWSGWGASTSVETWLPSKPAGFGLRLVECADPDKLRLFFLSLLWRAAATTLPAFDKISMRPVELELLRTMVLDGIPRPLDFYPTSLLQIVPRGDPHNIGPFPTDFSFRFYFDGLIAHMFRDVKIDLENVGQCFVGFSPTFWVQTQTFEHSFQLANIKQHILEGETQWQEVIGRLKSQPARR
jgi:hypothetical protein